MAGKDDTISHRVRRLVDADPCIRDMLARGLLNVSELARRLRENLAEDQSTPSLSAVKVALHRYAEMLRGNRGPRPSRDVVGLLARSSLELRTGITVATVELHALREVSRVAGKLLGRARFLLVMQGLTSVTLTVDDEHYDTVEEAVGKPNIIREYRGQAALVIVSPETVVSTPGFIAYVSSILADAGININQVESVYTDTIFILDPQDAVKAFNLLRNVIGLLRGEYGILKA